MVRSVSKQISSGWKEHWRPHGTSSVIFSVALVCFGLYVNAMHKKTQACKELKEKIHRVELVKSALLTEGEELRLELSSYDDDAWREMVLKKRLGVVPPGQMKVFFKKQE
jgi:hypothetical protein